MESTAASLEMMDMGEEALTVTMVMEEERRAAEQKASEEKRDGLFNRAKKGLEKVKEKLLGMTMLRNKEDDSIRIVKDLTVRKEEEEEFIISDLIEEGEEVSVEEEVDRGKDKKEEEKKSRSGSGQTTGGYSFLGDLDDEEKDSELEKKDKENRKRKRDEVKVTVKVKGLASSVGWKERSEAARGEERWKRTVEKEVGGEKSKTVEKIPLSGHYELGLDRRGMEINSSARKNNQFGSNKRALCRKKVVAGVRGGTGPQTSREEDVWDERMP